MWRPKPFTKHAIPEVAWPSAEEAQRLRWFQPIAVGPVTLTERTWVPAMVPWRATPDGEVTDAVVDWYARFAEGEPGAIVIEATGIRDVPSGPLLRIGADRFIPGLRRVVEAVRRASGGKTRLFIQLIDFLAVRRRVDRQAFVERFLPLDHALRERAELPEDELKAWLLTLPEPAFLACLTPRQQADYRFGYRERVTDVHLPHIQRLPHDLPPLFASAARRALEAGFDGVELHFAHAYTMASFLSATNTRADGYGGSLTGRARLPLEVLAATREATRGQIAVGARILTDEIISGGSRVNDARWFAERLAEAGLDFLSLSRGGRFEDAKQPKVGAAVYPYTGESGFECMPSVYADAQGPFGRNLKDSGELRRALREAGFSTPVVTAGGIHSPAQAEAILAAGQADIVAAARQSLADPDWFKKVRLGRGAEVRRCSYTNYCEALDQQHKAVTCRLWDHADLAAASARTEDGRRRLTAPPWLPREHFPTE